MSIKSLVLNKGWAGNTITREQTAKHLNALIRPLIELMYYYDAALASGGSGSDLDEVHATMPVLRADIGKLSETIHSCGAVAYSGTDLDPGSFLVGDNSWSAVRAREEKFIEALDEEKRTEHQMRTRAILGALASNANERLHILRRIG